MDKAKMLVGILDLLVIVTLSYVFVNLVTISLVSPENEIHTTERNPEFRWGGMQGYFVVLLDENPDFESPFRGEVSGNSYRPEEDLDFGTYYWKIESGAIKSGIRKFTVGSSVVLAREEDEVKNEGNTDIIVNTDKVTGMVVGVGNSVKIEEEENVKAEQA